MKICSKCHEEKDSSFFYPQSSWCKDCIHRYRKEQRGMPGYKSSYVTHTRNRKIIDPAFRKQHNEIIQSCGKKRWANDLEYRRAQQHRGMLRKRYLREQFKALSITERKGITQFYINCPKGHEVDHIYPVVHGGLHCLSNLQYLTIKENGNKFNKIPPNTDIDGTLILWS